MGLTGIANSLFNPLRWLGMALVVVSIVLFRRAAFQPKFWLQWLLTLGAVIIGFAGLVVPGGLSILNLIVLAVGLYVWHAVLKDPPPDRFYQRPLYQSGYWYLLFLNWFCSRGEWIGALVVTALYLVGYLVTKIVSRQYEYA